MGDLIRSTAEVEADVEGSAQPAMVALSTFLEGGTIVELGRLTGLSHSAAVRLVDRLADQGLIERDQGDDRRAVALRPTERGRAVGKRILAARETALASILNELSGPQRAELTPILEDLLSALVGRDGDPFRICRMCDAAACGHYKGRCPVTEAGRELAQLSAERSVAPPPGPE